MVQTDAMSEEKSIKRLREKDSKFISSNGYFLASGIRC